MPSEAVTRRLALVRYLHSIAVQQSQRPEPLGLVSILMFHDAVELYLQLASEQSNVSKPGLGFMEYWTLLEPEISQELAEKESMRRLNKARVDFKHYGILPSRLEIEGFRASVNNFLETMTPILFGIEFTSITMVNLVQCAEARASFIESTKLSEQGKYEEALDKIAVSFVQLIDDYENRKRTTFGASPFSFGESFDFLNSFFMGIKGGDFARFVDKVGDSIEALQDAVRLLSLGLDYRRFAKFRLSTPPVRKIVGGGYTIGRIAREKPATNDECGFCYDFVIESALRLQEFDFEVEGAR
jgi:hypothetical protein